MPEDSGAIGDETVEQPVSRSVFDTGGLPKREALECWREQLEQIAEPRFMKESEDDFHARVETVIVDKLVIGDTQITTQGFERSRFCIARHGVDHYVLHFFRNGRLICRQTETGSTLRPGDLLVADMTHPQRIALVDMDALHVAVPRPVLAPLLLEPDAYALRYIPGDNVLVQLLHDHMFSLVAHAPRMTVQQAQALMPSVLDLAAAAINGAVGERTVDGVGQSLTRAVRHHIGTHTLDPELTPANIAAHFGISPRKLSYLFQEDGGVATYIQHERLRLARVALMDPAQRSRTIGEIAEAHGFSHRTSFIRAFERAFDLTPGQQRALASQRRSIEPSAGEEPAPYRWA